MMRKMRWLIAGCLCVGMIVVISMALWTRSQSAAFRKAAAWHKVHSDVLTVDGHHLHLPNDWYAEGSGMYGMPRLFKASKALRGRSQSVIDFNQKGSNEMQRSGVDLQKSLAVLVAKDNFQKDEWPKRSLLEVQGVSTRMYCIKTAFAAEEVGLRCSVANGMLVINSAGPPETENEILSILSSFD